MKCSCVSYGKGLLKQPSVEEDTLDTSSLPEKKNLALNTALLCFQMFLSEIQRTQLHVISWHTKNYELLKKKKIAGKRALIYNISYEFHDF